MPKVQVALDTNEVLISLAELQADELETFVDEVLSLKARRKASHLSLDETSLLQRIDFLHKYLLVSIYKGLSRKRTYLCKRSNKYGLVFTGL
jgi:hypothetical protein